MCVHTLTDRLSNMLLNTSISLHAPPPPQGVKKGFIKGEALRLLGTNSSEKTLKRA